jgi:hypothetical protein
MDDQRTDRERGLIKPMWLRLALVLPIILNGTLMAFTIVSHGDSPLGVIAFLAEVTFALIYGAKTARIIVGPMPDDD